MTDLILTITMLLFALMAFRAHRLLSAALWLAGVSALLAILFYRLGAPEVAVIELSVGAGLVTVLFVFAISVAGEETIKPKTLFPWPLAAVLALAAAGLLGWLVLPAAGVPSVVVEQPLPEILWQERGLDLLVQVILIFSGVLGLLGLLAEAKAPLEQSAAAEVAARRERELAELQQKALQ